MDRFKEIEGMIGQPKGQRLEYRSILPPSAIMAQLICSFANSQGGFIVLGVSDRMEINGLSSDFHTDPITQKALSLLIPQPNIFSKNISIKGKRLFVIAVDKAENIIRLDGKKYIRDGTITRFSDPAELKFDVNGFIYQTIDQAMNKNEQDKGISYNEYDINLTQSFFKLERQLKDITQTKTGITKEDYLSRIKGGIESYAKFHQLGSLDSPMPIILKYPAYNYHAHLAFQLVTFDLNKIWAVLDYQHENYLGLDNFQKIVEHGVYNWIKQNSPFENNSRLQKIMEWVEKRKSVEHKNNKIAKAVGNKILEKFKSGKVEIGEIVMLQVIHNIYNNTLPPEKKLFNGIFRGMIFDGFIECDDGEPNFIRLGDKGYKKIYEEAEQQQEINREKIENLPVVVILTAIGEEYSAVRNHLVNRKVWKKDSVIFEQGTFIYNGIEIAKVFIRECGAKNVNSAQETQRALTFHKPDCILFVGIAGSKKPHDFKIGDVIFPEKVHYYEGGKSELSGFNPRSDDVRPTFALYEIAKLERHNPEWKTLIKTTVNEEVTANLGVVASGEQVVEHYDSEIGKVLSLYYGDSACIEMEGYGFLNTIQRQGGDFAIDFAGVVRGVSDVLEQNTNISSTEDTVNKRPAEAKKIASETAAAFAYWLIVKVFETCK